MAAGNVGATQARLLCDKLRGAIAAHAWDEIHPDLRVTMSIGVAALQREENLGSVLRVADQLLYHAKSNGRNQVYAAT